MSPTPTPHTRGIRYELTRRDFLVASSLAAAGLQTTSHRTDRTEVAQVALSEVLLARTDLITPVGERYVEWDGKPDNQTLIGHVRKLIPEMESAPFATRVFVAREGTDAPRYIESAAIARVPRTRFASIIGATDDWFRATRGSITSTSTTADDTYAVQWSTETLAGVHDILQVGLINDVALFTAALGPHSAIVTPTTAVQSYSMKVHDRIRSVA